MAVGASGRIMSNMQRDVRRGTDRARARTCSNEAPKWEGKDLPGTSISTESCNLHKCKKSSQKLKTSKVTLF